MQPTVVNLTFSTVASTHTKRWLQVNKNGSPIWWKLWFHGMAAFDKSLQASDKSYSAIVVTQFFKKMGQPRSLFRLFLSFQTSITILTTNKCEKCKHLQNFDHPSNHFISSSKILKWYKTVQKFYQGLKVFKPRKNFLSEFTQNFCEILRKIQNFATKTKQKNLPRMKFFRLSEEIFTFLNRRCTDLEILQVLRKMYTVMRFKPMTFGIWVSFLNH